MEMKRIWKISFIILIVTILSFFILCQINIVEASNFVVQANAEKNLNIKKDTSNVYYKIEKISDDDEDEEDEEENLWTFGNIIAGADNFLDNGQEQVENETTINDDTLNDTNALIYNLLFGIGVVLAVIIGGVLGIKFMIASAEEKADIKNAMIPYIIGCIVIFGAFAIWKIAVNLLQATI